ncbi:MAG: hypothetical protein LBB52_02575 [Desulfovibrio sp.]|jgi:hypothetical protein|nr:hypothetical protein [Desulfovibrio sp.]
MQGTLDFACAVYAVINAVSCVYYLDLAAAREIFQRTLLHFSENARAWEAFVNNRTDHYWVVRYMLRRWCAQGKLKLEPDLPFSRLGLPLDQELDLNTVSLFLPENHPPKGPENGGGCAGARDNPAAAAEGNSPATAGGDPVRAAGGEADTALEALRSFFARIPPGDGTAILRFHRFQPSIATPIVSHWTTVSGADSEALRLWDSSSADGAMHSLPYAALLCADSHPSLRVVPESIYLLSRPGTSPAPGSSATHRYSSIIDNFSKSQKNLKNSKLFIDIAEEIY